MTRPAMPEPVVELVPDSVEDPVLTLAPAPDERPTVDLCGRPFPVAEHGVDLLALMEFAAAAKAGLRTEDMDGLLALYDLLRSVIADDAWPEFRAHARTSHATGEELIGVVRSAVQVMAARPTRPPSGSPGGRSTTGTNSAAGSSSPVATGSVEVQRDLEVQGRPDLALAVKRARQGSTPT